MKKISLILLCVTIAQCMYAQTTAKKQYTAVLVTKTDAEYPDNNSIGYRSLLAGKFNHDQIVFTEVENGNYDIKIPAANSISDTIEIKDVNLLEFMPSIPNYVKGNDYLTYLALLNQEWNRIQVKFNSKLFSVKGKGEEKNTVIRVDLANNCLGKGEWEFICFTSENDKEVLYFQCWFNFPETLFNELFLLRNGITIAQYDNMLKNYGNRPSEAIDLNNLRTVSASKTVNFTNLNTALYPIKGERQTKAKNIISPLNPTSINDFLNNDTKFATFASPGMYTRTQPRATELGRFKSLETIDLLQTVSTNAAQTKTIELQLHFKYGSVSTNYIIGGLVLENIPLLNPENLHNGFQRSMGIANHSFYSAYADIVKNSSKENPYFGLLTNDKGFWLDSHQIGTDGPLLFRDEANPDQLHILLLSFERHAFVGHYVVNIPQ